MEFLLIGVVWIVVLGGVGLWIALQKGRSGEEGIALGCLLGPIGWIIEAVLPAGEAPATPATPRTSRQQTPRPHLKPPPPPPPMARAVADSEIVPWEESADSHRPVEGTNGTPPLKRRYTGGNPRVVMSELLADDRRGLAYRVVEAVWENTSDPVIAAAFGEPTKQYDLVWPGQPRVRWRDETAPASVAPTDRPTPESQPTQLERTTPLAETYATNPDTGVAPEANGSRSTKVCPDCAETILEAARVCRFCRYEFWPADTPPPATPVDVPDDAGIMLTPEAATPPDEMPETRAEVAAVDAAPAEPGKDAAQQDEPPQPDPLLVESPPPTPEPEAWSEQREPIPPALPPPPYAPPAPPRAAPAPSYPPQRPPYTPPPPGWQPPQGQQLDQGQRPWAPPPTRPPDRPREPLDLAD